MSTSIADDRDLPPLFDIGAVLKTLWDRRVLILAVAGAAVMAAVLYLAVTKPVYTATASILVDPRDSRATSFDSVLPGIGADSAAIASQVAVIDSTDLLRAVFDAEKLQDDPEFTRRGLLSTLLSPFRSSKPVDKDAVFANFRSKVSVEREGLTYVIDIGFKSQDPEKAARIVKAIVERYKASLSGEKEIANNEANTLLTEKIGGLQKAVSDAERAIQDFKFEHRIFDAEAGGTLQSQIDQFSTQLVAAQDQADQAQSRYDQALAAGTSPEGLSTLSAILSSATAEKLRQDYNDRAASLANAQTDLGPKHPTIARLSAELAKIRNLMGREAQRITQELKANRDIAAQNVKQLQAKLDKLRFSSNDSNLAQVQLRQLQRKADAARAVLDDFLKRSQETLHMQGMQISQVREISEAVPPVQPSWPKPTLLLAVSMVLGLILGCALALLLGPVEARSAMRRSERKGRLDATPDGPPTPPRRAPRPVASNLVDLGGYAVPAGVDATVRGGVHAIRLEVQRFDSAPFLSSMQRLLVAITNRLNEHPKPFVLFFSSIQQGAERNLAAALVGIGLQHIRERVLVVEIAGQPGQPVHHLPAPRSRRPVVDPASGLPTVVVDAMVMSNNGPMDNAATVAQVLAEQKGAFDFALVIGRPLSEPFYSPVVAARADLAIYVLNPAQRGTGALSWLRQRLAVAGPARTATVVIEQSLDAMRPRPVAANSATRRKTAAARG
ncbi:MAG: GumC family protein [Mesorhizobium sp.]